MIWELGILAGALAGLGLALVVRELVPAQPHLRATLGRLHDTGTETTRALEPQATQSGSLFQDRLGRFLEQRLPTLVGFRLPRQELDLLRIPAYRYYGEKALWALLGLAFPAILTLTLAITGVSLPFTVPAFVGLILAVVMWFLPDIETRQKANNAREEFTRALGAYIDLVALERAGGAGSTQALENAAEVGDSWVFQRLREELARARWSGTTPWEGLHTLSIQLGLSDLDDLADIMRLSGEEGATVYESLRARASGLRDAMLSAEHARANADSERMVMPVALLGVVFMALLAAPTVMRMLE
ncbi:type II secretion system F family protein [Jiangella sp. DSM 45060]|uniref:type II secretion system F family protein n=1 Tax=Jiangella sp. DSM 45060 TaxID=1798224 RepID=UPI000879CED8|nr:type II secretion system F family protein [Jiangella sp. DSM 45060]SDT68768.1 Type II secretion system (T2SS), protein F [Jiangella sp. DSM 45060]